MFLQRKSIPRTNDGLGRRERRLWHTGEALPARKRPLWLFLTPVLYHQAFSHTDSLCVLSLNFTTCVQFMQQEDLAIGCEFGRTMPYGPFPGASIFALFRVTPRHVTLLKRKETIRPSVAGAACCARRWTRQRCCARFAVPKALGNCTRCIQDKLGEVHTSSLRRHSEPRRGLNSAEPYAWMKNLATLCTSQRCLERRFSRFFVANATNDRFGKGVARCALAGRRRKSVVSV